MLELRAALTDSLKKSSAMIVNTMNFLEQEAVKIIQEMFPASLIFTTGPFHKLAPSISSSLLKEDTNCISWLNQQSSKSVIYVSFGSMASIDQKELLETAWGLADSEQPFLWVIRPGMLLSPTVSLKSSDNESSAEFDPLTEPGLSTHKKGCLLLARPQAISASSFSSMVAMLPKLTYITEFSVCLSSHVMQLWSSSHKLHEDVGAIFCIGPIEKFGTWHCCCNCANDDCSRKSMLFQMMAEDVPVFHFKSLELVPGLDPLRFKDLPILPSVFENLDAYLQLVTSVQNIGTSSAIIFNSMDCLDQSSLARLQQECQIPIFAIGPMHKLAPEATSISLHEEDRSCITWLDKQATNSVIYVSLGSIASVNEKEIAEMAWGLANSNQPFLWVIRPGLVRGSESKDPLFLPDDFKQTVGERGCIVKWAPQKQVLAHKAVGGFWSHCGWNSTIESISKGVPMICRPFFGDQSINTRYISHVWRVGIELENDFEREDVERAIRRLMVRRK
ncbi:hypothetical protein EZV62_002790 [Acer yangbiense]|uniref:Glycosyltransferase n=1 Tax=Acer yangbiense TaxID=1000413 RepID=A0A5C7IY49_9ROSI|nr:hypothetical protein EZV62_002790 [Acer yangbiense]